jgi:hypothetical protein
METPGYPCIVHVVVPVFWNTNGMICEPAAPCAWPTDTDNCPVVHGAPLAEVVGGVLVVLEAGTVVDGFVDVVVGCAFFVVVEVVVFVVLVGLPLLQPAATAPASTTAHPTCSPLRYIISPLHRLPARQVYPRPPGTTRITLLIRWHPGSPTAIGRPGLERDECGRRVEQEKEEMCPSMPSETWYRPSTRRRSSTPMP